MGDGPGAMTRVAAGLAGPGGSATPGRVLGSGEDVRTVPSWRPLRSASHRDRRCAGGRTRAHRASVDGAPARSHHEELTERAPTKCGPRVYRWRASLWRHFCATTMEAAGGTAFEWPQAVSGSPQWGVAPSTVPVDDQASHCCPGASSLKQLHVLLGRRGGVANNRH